MQPYFQSMSEFFAMGNHGVYVWSCWGIVFIVVISLIISSYQQRKRILQEIKHQQHRQKNRSKHQVLSKSTMLTDQHDVQSNHIKNSRVKDKETSP